MIVLSSSFNTNQTPWNTVCVPGGLQSVTLGRFFDLTFVFKPIAVGVCLTTANTDIHTVVLRVQVMRNHSGGLCAHREILSDTEPTVIPMTP